MHRISKLAPLLVVVALLGGGAGRTAFAQEAPCADCHVDDAPAGKGTFPLRAYREGVHAKVECAKCHRRPEGSFSAVPHTKTEPDLTKCTACHGLNLKEFKAEHRKGVHGELSCGECHDAHTMRPGREIADLDVRTSIANGPCLVCHSNVALGGEAEGHLWLPARDRHARMRCLVCHAPLGSERDHEIVPAAQATRDCEACHKEDGVLVRKYAGEDDRSTWVTNPLLFNQVYVPGAARNRLLDRTLLALFGLTIAGALGHGLLRLAARARRVEGPYEVHSTRLYPLGLRLWHWTNALLMVALAITGMRIHFGGREKPILTFEEAFNLHNVLGVIVVLVTIAYFVRNAVTRDSRQYLGKPEDGVAGVVRQVRYYLQGIFRGEEHPYHATPERRFNPLQQLTYASVMYVLVPLISLTGIVLLYPQALPDTIGDRSAAWWVANAHYLSGWGLVLFLLGHLYLTTTGDRITYLIRGMVTGEHRYHVRTPQTPARDPAPAAPPADGAPPAAP